VAWPGCFADAPELALACLANGCGQRRCTVLCLLELGADPNAVDKNGTAPLHRAVRNRCAAAAKALLDAGADPHAANRSGSTAAQLARWTTGRGGTGSPEAKAEQREIVRLLEATGCAWRTNHVTEHLKQRPDWPIDRSPAVASCAHAETPESRGSTGDTESGPIYSARVAGD